MICQYCGGQVVWMGPLSQLTHTECQDCGRTNCQEVDDFDAEDNSTIIGLQEPEEDVE